MFHCKIEWLKPVEGHKPGDIQAGLVHDQMVDQWAGMGLLRVLSTARPPVPPRNSSRAAWRDFLLGVGIWTPDTLSRAELIEEWNNGNPR